VVADVADLGLVDDEVAIDDREPLNAVGGDEALQFEAGRGAAPVLESVARAMSRHGNGSNRSG
jgi:hypothetical protein